MADAPDPVFRAKVSPGAKALGALLWRYADHRDAEPFVWPAMTTMTELLDQAASSTRRQMGELRAAGLLRKSSRQQGGRTVWGWVLIRDPAARPPTSEHQPPTNERSTADASAPTSERPTADARARDRRPVSARPPTSEHISPMKPQEAPMKPQPAEPPDELELKLQQPASKPITPRELVDGKWDHLPRAKAAKDPRIREACCEAHHKAFGGRRRRHDSEDARKYLTRMLKAHPPSDVVRAIVGCSKDPVADRTKYRDFAHVWRGFDRFVDWTHDGAPSAGGKGGHRDPRDPHDRDNAELMAGRLDG